MRSNACRVLVFLLACGCSHGGEENLGLEVGRASEKIDVSGLTRPAELERALQLPGEALDRLLGAHRLEATTQLKVEAPGAPVETVTDEYTLDSDGRGALHLIHDTSHQDGMEAVVSGGQLYVRLRYEPFVRRKPEGDEVARLRAAAEDVAADDLEVLLPWLTVRAAGQTTLAGRNAFRFTLAAAPSATPHPPERDPGRRWRDTVKVRYVDGQVTADAASGAPLAVKLDAAYTFERAGKTIAVTLGLDEKTTAPEPIVAPADAQPDPERPRPMRDRQALLEGLK